MQPIFNYDLIEDFRRRALLKNAQGANFILKYIAEDLKERLLTVDRVFDKALELHGHTGDVAQSLMQSGKIKTIDRVETQSGFIKVGHLSHRESLQLPKQYYDLIVSPLSLQMVNDVAGVLTQINMTLKPDSLFLGIMAGSGTLIELRESLLQAEAELYDGVSPRIYPFADVRDIGALLQRTGFIMPVSDIENLTVRYHTMFDLMRDLRQMGMQNALLDRSWRPVSRRFFNRAAQIYAEKFSDADGKIRASFSFIALSGWSKGESQQKPMKPGTAQISLKDVLEKK